MAHAPQLGLVSETEYFAASGIRITDKRLIFPGETYVMSNISSVRLTQQEPSRFLEIAAILAGFGTIYFGYTEHADEKLVLGIGLVAAGLLIWFLRKPRFIVTLGAAGGERKAFQSKNKDLVLDIIDGINRAIVGRG